MGRHGFHVAVSAVAFVLLPVAAVQSQDTSENPGASGTEAIASPNDVIVTVNGHAIVRAEIEKLFVTIARDRYHGRPHTEGELDRMRPRHWSDVVSAAVNNWLLDHEMGDADIVVSDAELAEVMDMELEVYFAISGTTRAQFDARVRDKSGITLHELRAGRNANPFYREAVRRDQWIAAKFADEIEVTGEDINDAFERMWSGRTLPAQVRVSHILIAANTSDSGDSKETARKKMAAVFAEARKSGTDFATLARTRSGCASASKGGDLGFIHRQGETHDAFAEAAFALKVGEISGVVETPDGYHIIKLTERLEPRAVTLPLVEEVIRTGLRKRTIGKARRDYVEKLKSSATIVYTDNPPPGE